MAKSYEELKKEISTITNEVEDGANTANRIGNAMADIVDYAKEVTDTQGEELLELESNTEQKLKDLVVQEKGQNETKVMSQKAVTEEINKITLFFDGGRADTVYGGAREVNCGGADAYLI